MRKLLAVLSFVLVAPAQVPLEEIELKGKREFEEEALEVREVRESPAKDVGEALSKVEGLWKIRKGGVANDVVLRGFQQGNLNVLVDGARIFGACPNHMDPAAFHVDFAEVERVEVVKGAFDVRNHGSLGGLVRILSKRPPAGFHVTTNLSAGSFGALNPSTSASYSGDKLRAVVGYSFRRALPYLDGTGKRVTEYANYREFAQTPNAYTIHTGWTRVSLSPASGHLLEVAYTRQAGGEVLYPYLLMDAVYDNADRLKLAYAISPAGGRLKALRIESYFTQVKHWMTDENRTSSAGGARGYRMATYAGTKAAGGRMEAELTDVVIGVEAYRRNWSAVNTMLLSGAYTDQRAIPNVNQTAGGLFGEYDRRFSDRLRISGGVRLDRVTSEARDADAGLYWAYKGTRALSATNTDPTANIRFAYSLPFDLELFAGVGHATRPPDPRERYFSLRRMNADWVGNPALRPTRNTEVDAGVNYRRGRYYVKPALFYSRLADFVTIHSQPLINPVAATPNRFARTYENVDARMYGGELTSAFAFTRTLLLSAGLSYVRGVKHEKPGAGIRDRDIAETPPLKSRLTLRYGTKAFFAEPEVVMARRQTRVDSDLREQDTPGYAVLNLKGGLHIGKFFLVAGLENLLDREYWEHLSYQRDPFRSGAKIPEPGRNLYLNVSYTF